MNPSEVRAGVDRLAARWVPVVLVATVALLWASNVSWKVPPDFGDTARGCSGLCGFVEAGIDHPVAPGSAWILDNVVRPQLALFGWVTLFVEAALAALLLSRRHLRIAAVLGMAQSLAIGLTVANAPHEWYWSYLLMVALHLAVLAWAAALRPASARAMAVVTAAYGAVVAAAHLESGFTGDGNSTWTLFAGSNDLPGELGRGTFPGSIALGLVLSGLALAAWFLAGAAPRSRATGGWALVGLAVLLLITYDPDGLLLGLGSRAVTAAVVAALGLSLTPIVRWPRRTS